MKKKTLLKKKSILNTYNNWLAPSALAFEVRLEATMNFFYISDAFRMYNDLAVDLYKNAEI